MVNGSVWKEKEGKLLFPDAVLLKNSIDHEY